MNLPAIGFARDGDAHFESDFKAIASLFRFGREAHGRVLRAVIMILAASGCLMSSAATLGKLAQRLSEGATLSDLWVPVGLILSLELANVGLSYFGRITLAGATNDIALSIRRELFQKISRLPVRYFDTQPLGRTLMRLTSDIDGIEKFFSGSLSKVVAAIISISAVLVAMLVTDLGFGTAIVATSIPAIVFTILSRTPVRYWLRRYKVYSAEVNSRLAEFINSITLIKALGLEDWSHELFVRGAKEQLQAGIKIVNWNSFIRPTAALLCSLPTLVILWYGGHRVLEGTLSVAVVVSFVRFAERFFWPVMAVTQEIHVIQEAFTSSERICQILDAEEEQRTSTSSQYQGVLQGDIAFNKVWMNYHSGVPVLRGVSFKVKSGTKIGLVGATGSGKSSTMNLLPGLYPIQSGSIRVDGNMLSDWNMPMLRRQLGIVSQDVVIFRGSLRENLLVALPDGMSVSDADLLNVLGTIGFTKIMHRFTAGLATILSDGGENLSMGERQLIAFARMILRNPRLLILDEATANIDEECEQVLHQAMHSAMAGRTCFIIAHRLSTVRELDHILVFDQGEIVEQGTHSSLVAQAGLYASLVSKQFSD